MKAPRLLALAAPSLLGLLASCHQPAANTPCPDQETAGSGVQLYPCVPDRNSQETKLFMLNSAQEFADAFPCSSYRPRPAAFGDSTLLVGWKNYCCCGRAKSQRLAYSCATNTYTYHVEIEAGVCSAALPVTSQLLVPKLPAGTRVLLDMQ